MAALNSKIRTDFDEWLANILDDDLKTFVFDNTTEEVEFGSEDFKLVHCGISDGDPVGCHMIEARINGRTKNKQLKKLLITSGSVGRTRTRLAFALFPRSMDGHCLGQHVRQALRESPIQGQRVVNKVHVQWSPSMPWEGFEPRYTPGSPPFVYEKIPFEGLKVDGTTLKKKDRNKK